MMQRRDYIRRIGIIGVGSVSIPVVSAQTDSGEIEIDVNAYVPTNTSITIEIWEDLGSDGTTDNTQSIDIQDGINTYILDGLEGDSSSSNAYALDISFNTTDEWDTPRLDSCLLILPESDITPTPTPTQTTEEKSFIYRLLESDGQDVSNPNTITMQISLLLAILYSLIGYMSIRINSVTVWVAWGIALLTIPLVVLLDLSYTYILASLALVVTTMAIDIGAKAGEAI